MNDTESFSSSSPMQRRNSNQAKFVIVTLLVLVIVGGLIAVFLKLNNEGKSSSASSTPTSIDSSLQYSTVDVENLEGEDRLPEGFPEGLPADLETITDSSNSVFDNGASSQAELVYTSEEDVQSLADSYREYFEENDYEVKESGSNSLPLILNASKEEDMIKIVFLKAGSEGSSYNVFITVVDES